MIKDLFLGKGFLSDFTYSIDDTTCYLCNTKTGEKKSFKTGLGVNQIFRCDSANI